MQDVVEMMIKISETSRAQSAAGTLSKNKSGNGPYFVRSGTRSWTKAKDVVVRNQLAKRKTSAEQRHKGDPSTKWIQTIPASGSPEANQNEGPANGRKKRNVPISVLMFSRGNLGSSRCGAGTSILTIPPFPTAPAVHPPTLPFCDTLPLVNEVTLPLRMRPLDPVLW